MDPNEADARLEQLMAERDAVIPPPGVSRDSPEFTAFMAAENKVGAFMDAHDHELAALRLPHEGMTVERYEAKLAELDAELDWLAERAVPDAPSQEAYSAAWKDRMAFVANYGPDTWIGSMTPEPEPDPEPELGIEDAAGVVMPGDAPGSELPARLRWP